MNQSMPGASATLPVPPIDGGTRRLPVRTAAQRAACARATGSAIPDASPDDWLHLARWVEERLGLDFTGPRMQDLQRGFACVLAELGLDAAGPGIRRLLGPELRPDLLHALTHHLTVGETYFMRDPAAWQALEQVVLPELIRARRQQAKYLRLWCAACCTGEEAYSLAILLRRMLPDLADWSITLVASDLNARFLDKARAGVYGRWSFRDAPDWLQPRYFETQADGSLRIAPPIRRMVRFETHNLIDPLSPGSGLRAMDLVICRNVLMYFSQSRAAQAVGHLSGSLGDRGWLMLAPGELPHATSRAFERVPLRDTILLRKQPRPVAAGAAGKTVPPPASHAHPLRVVKRRLASRLAAALRAPVSAAEAAREAQREARDSANRGRHDEALGWCACWIAHDRLDPGAHYVQAVVLQERQDRSGAQAALQRALFLDEGFVMAHVALGQLARDNGDRRAALRCFEQARRLVRNSGAQAELREADGLTVAQLRTMLDTLIRSEGTA